MAADTGWQSLLLRDGDTGIHIRIGDLILASHHVPGRGPVFVFENRPGPGSRTSGSRKFSTLPDGPRRWFEKPSLADQALHPGAL